LDWRLQDNPGQSGRKPKEVAWTIGRPLTTVAQAHKKKFAARLRHPNIGLEHDEFRFRRNLIAEVVGTFFGRECLEDVADGGAYGFDHSSVGFSQQVLSLAKICSIGLRSGEYLGRKKSLAPVERISSRTALPL
jgi:hypothetical protein